MAKKGWLATPVSYSVYVSLPLAVRQFATLQNKAGTAGKSPEDYIATMVTPKPWPLSGG